MRRLALSLLVLIAGCKKSTPSEEAAPHPGDAPAVSKVREALAKRDARVESYRYRGETVQGSDKATYVFTYRAPNKMRGDYESAHMVFAFDGHTFRQWDEGTKTLTEIDLSAVPRDRATAFLHQVFAPFAPEGWRTPLIAGKVSAVEKDEGGKPVVEVTSEVPENPNLAITWKFASPSMDLLGKTAKGGGSSEVQDRFCDEKLKLCFPSKVKDNMPGGLPAVTTLTDIAVNLPVPPETFEPKATEGGRVEKRELPPDPK